MILHNFSEKESIPYHATAILISVFLFTIDLTLPLGYAAGTSYVFVLAIIYRLRSINILLYYSGLCTLLTVTGFFLSVNSDVYSMAVMNRSVSIMVIWLTTWFCISLNRNINHATNPNETGVIENSDIHNQSNLINQGNTRLPPLFIWITILFCITPYTLNLFGLDFGNTLLDKTVLLAQPGNIDIHFNFFAGAFTHTLLEWSAFSTALFTFIVAIIHYRISNNHIILIIATALLSAGCMDAFHTLAANRLIDSVANNTNLIPFTWAIARTFNALILIMGIMVLLIFGNKKANANMSLVTGSSVVFFILAFIIVQYCANSQQLPKTMFPDNFISRPWDVGPLILYLLAGTFLFPYFYKKHPSFFAASLILSMFPNVILEMHMAFGSNHLFDNHFNIAHFLKIVAYLVPFIGLLLDYIRSYHMGKKAEETTRLYKTLRLTFDSTPNALIMVDTQGVIHEVNNSMLKLFGYDRGELIGQKIEKLIPEKFRDGHVQNRLKFHASPSKRSIGEGRDIFGLTKDGIELPIEIGLNPMQTELGMMVISSIMDISDRLKQLNELKYLNDSLEKTNDELQRSNKELDDFAYVASHDLKAPLRGIDQLASFIEEDAGNILPDASLEDLKLLRNRINRMENLLNSLLQYSRIGRKEGQPGWINTQKLLTDVIEMYVPSERFKVELPDELPQIYAPHAAVELVFRNIIMNAVKHHDKDEGVIHIETSQDKDTVDFFIYDDGPGIPEAHKEKIFQLFQTLKARDKVEGSGMGLALVKKTVELHGGSVELVTENERGACFRVSWHQPELNENYA